jgi:hypothetical protein
MLMLGLSEADAILEITMAVSTKRWNEWHQVHGKWTRSFGERGMRVRLFQNRRGGKFFREIWIEGQGKNRKCINTADRAQAEQIGRDLLASLLR